jgi:hypothetical protein
MPDAADFSYSQEATSQDLLGRDGRISRALFVSEQLDKRSLYFLQDGALSLNLFQEASSTASGQRLLTVARANDWLTEDELADLTVLRQFRNSLVHFKDPLDLNRPEIQALLSARTTAELLEKRARTVIRAIGHVLNYTAL